MSTIGKDTLETPRGVVEQYLQRVLVKLTERLNQFVRLFAKAEGGATTFLRDDMTWATPGVGSGGVELSDVPATALGSASAGTGTDASRYDHVHAHGSLAGGSLHAVATGADAGFMSATDKTKLDSCGPVLVFKEGGGGTGPGVYGTWASLYAALQAMRAAGGASFVIEIDDTTTSPCVISANSDLTGVVLRGALSRRKQVYGNNYISLNIADGIVVTGLREIRGGIDLTVSPTATSPVALASGDHFTIRDACRVRSSSATVAAIDATAGGVEVVIDDHSILGDGTRAAINLGGSMGTFFIGGSSRISEDGLKGTGASNVRVVYMAATARVEYQSLISPASIVVDGDGTWTSTWRYRTVNVTGPASATPEPGDMMVCNPTGGAISLDLLDTTPWNDGQSFMVVNTKSTDGAITITPDFGIDTIGPDGATSLVLGPYASIKCVSDYANRQWQVQGSTQRLRTGTATLDFGAFPGKSDASVAVTGQTGIVEGSVVQCWLYPTATADHTADEHMIESIKVVAGNIVAGTGFTIYGFNTSELPEGLQSPGVTTFRSVTAGQVSGYAAPSVGGTGTLVYGTWTVKWSWL